MFLSIEGIFCMKREFMLKIRKKNYIATMSENSITYLYQTLEKCLTYLFINLRLNTVESELMTQKG